MLLHSWAQSSQTSCMWKWFFEHPNLMLDPECPLIPAVRLLEHGDRTFIVTPVRPWRSATCNLRRLLERVRDGFNALAWLHRHEISLNHFHEPFISLYAQLTGTAKERRGPAGSPERFACTEKLPDQPASSFPSGVPDVHLGQMSHGLPWSEVTADNDPRVPGPRLVSLCGYALPQR